MKMKSVVAVAAMAVAMSGAAASAQTTNSNQAGSTQQASSNSQAMSANAFVQEAAVGGMAEVELGKLASERASSDQVKQFAQRIVTDHSKANDELKALAQRKSIMVPGSLDAKHKATHDKLAKLSGAAFDRAYMEEVRDDHRKDVEAFREQSRSGSDPDIKAFAAKTLPTLEAHLKLAEQTNAAVGTSGNTDKDKPNTTGTSGTTIRPGDRGTGSGTGTPGNTAPTPGTPGTPGSPGAGSDPRNQPGSIPGTGIQR